MEHKVINDFVCKESGVHYTFGSFFVSDNFQRVKELEEKGFIEANANVSSLEVKEVKEKKSPAKNKKVNTNATSKG